VQKRSKGRPGPRKARSPIPEGPLEAGTTIRDIRENKTGVIMEFACQYAHPKAQPVYNYLVRWQDGQVQAINETALTRDHGLELVD
jgi:hypothetical protein